MSWSETDGKVRGDHSPLATRHSQLTTHNSQLVLGVDGGNTKTVALVAGLDGTIRGTGRGGCGDIYGAGSAEAALAAVEEAVEAACAAAGVATAELATGAFSMAGADWPEDFAYLRGEMRRRGYGGAVTIVNDAIGALRAGSPSNTGVVVVCGTGVAIGARSLGGQVWHTSFWQEPQGGHELGQKALRALYRAELGIDPPTSLTPRVLAHLDQSTVEGVLHLMTARQGLRPPRGRIAGLARLLLDEAARGDAAARQIVETHGSSLGDYALAAARRVGLEGSAFPLVLMGGVLRHPSPLLGAAIARRVRTTSPRAAVLTSRFEPAVGALLLALEAAGGAMDEDVVGRLHDTMPPAAFFET